MIARLSFAGAIINLLLLFAFAYALVPSWQSRQALAPTVTPDAALVLPNGYHTEQHGGITFLYGPFSISTEDDDEAAYRVLVGQCVVLVDTASPFKAGTLRISKTMTVCINVGSQS